MLKRRSVAPRAASWCIPKDSLESYLMWKLSTAVDLFGLQVLGVSFLTMVTLALAAHPMSSLYIESVALRLSACAGVAVLGLASCVHLYRRLQALETRMQQYGER